MKTGGLADVAGALPRALSLESVEMRSVVPAYPAIRDKLADVTVAREYRDLFGGPARVEMPPDAEAMKSAALPANWPR